MVNCAIVRLTEGFSLFAVIVLYKPPERLTMIDLRRNLSSLAFCQSQQPLCRTVGTRFKFRACSLGYESTFFFFSNGACAERKSRTCSLEECFDGKNVAIFIFVSTIPSV